MEGLHGYNCAHTTSLSLSLHTYSHSQNPFFPLLSFLSPSFPPSLSSPHFSFLSSLSLFLSVIPFSFLYVPSPLSFLCLFLSSPTPSFTCLFLPVPQFAFFTFLLLSFTPFSFFYLSFSSCSPLRFYTSFRSWDSQLSVERIQYNPAKLDIYF